VIKKFTIQIVIRVLLILAFSVVFSYFLLNEFWFSMVGIGLFIIFLVYLLIRYVNATNYSLVKFMSALRNGDYSVYFSPTRKGDSFSKVYDDFNEIIRIFKQNKIEKEAQYNFFRVILEHVNLGIIAIRQEDLEEDKSENEILFLNKAATDLLQQPHHKYWHRLAKQVSWFADEVRNIQEGGKLLIDRSDAVSKRQISLEVIKVTVLDIPYLIISFQDIRSEIEQKEIEAWHNVIRILAHEMLNSFTPVGSLAETIITMTEDEDREVISKEELPEDTLEDIHQAATTIKRRSDGLLNFVNDYRTITNVPVPQMEKISVKELLTEISTLMEGQAIEHQVALKLGTLPTHAAIQADGKLIEQVLINLINNSFHALKGRNDPTITLSCRVSPETTTIEVTDNGIGIEQSIVNQVFIPFFTTRKHGSGIGLSLSKNIMKKHNGNLRVVSEPGEFTTFYLIFKNLR
jgi:nitrogen fixation/metabolism regulation signal transduction histidine kinase